MFLLNWLYEHKNSLNLKMSLASWPERARLDLYDVEMSIQYNEKIFLGRGVDKIEKIAIKKAATEVIERLLCSELNISSTGIAIKVDSESFFDADLHAKNETLERYFLKLHLDNNIQFLNVVPESELISKFKKHHPSVEISFFKLNSSIDFFSYGCLIKEEAVVSTGFSAEQDSVKALEKSFIEALPNFYFSKENSIDDSDKPWHLKASFINQVTSLVGAQGENIYLPEPILKKIDLNLKEHPLLKTAPISASKYEVVIG